MTFLTDSTPRPPRILQAVAISLVLGLTACGGSAPASLGSSEEGLLPCPDTPNCVHTGDRHPPGTAPLLLSVDALSQSPDQLAAALQEAVEALPRTRVVHSETSGDLYLHAEARSLVFRFVDDLEIHLGAESGELVVRSASRMGRSDLGVNGRRVEDLRGLLMEQGIVEG
jgi:uncharacterized protein (DUF1499 family)